MVAANVLWSKEHSSALQVLLEQGLSYSISAGKLNETFGTTYTRNACISKGKRMNINSSYKRSYPATPSSVYINRTAAKRKAKRWAENPALAERAKLIERNRERRAMLAKCGEMGTPKTSPVYRKQLPALGSMTKRELREMLTQAVQNTANMGVT